VFALGAFYFVFKLRCKGTENNSVNPIIFEFFSVKKYKLLIIKEKILKKRRKNMENGVLLKEIGRKNIENNSKNKI